jgi:hypothetical protein
MRPDWLPTRQFNPIVKLNLKKRLELPDVPAITEFARSEAQR